MAKRLCAVNSSDNHCKRKRTASPVKASEEYAENYGFKKKYATASEDDSASSGNKKRKKIDGREQRTRHCEANAERAQHYYRAPTSGRYCRKSYAQSSEINSTTDSETTLTTSSCESRQGQLVTKQKQISNEDLYNLKTEFKYKRIAGGAKKSLKRTKTHLETPTDEALRLEKRAHVRAQTVRTENADENTNNGTTKEMVRFMNKLLISLGNVENSFSAAVNSVSTNRQRAQRILNNKSANNLTEKYAHDAQPIALKIKSPNTRGDERELQYAPQSAVYFNAQLPSAPETPNYISTHSAQFNGYGPSPTAATATSDLPPLPRLSAAQQAALPAIQTLNALQRKEPNVTPTNQLPLENAEYQPYQNGLPVLTNVDAKAGNEYAHLNMNSTLNQNPKNPAGLPNRPFNNLKQIEVGSVTLEQNMALPGNIQAYYNSIDYNGDITKPQINGNYREIHENETSQENTLNRGSMSERQSKSNRGSLSKVEYTAGRGRVSDRGSATLTGKNETNRGRVSDRGSTISSRESKANRRTISDRGTVISNRQNKERLSDRGSISNGGSKAPKGSTKSVTNKAYSIRGQSDSADANGEYSNGNEKTSALDEMFAEINPANEMRRRTTTNGNKFSTAPEKESDESQSVEETSSSCNSDYIRKCLRRKRAQKHNKYDDKQRKHNKNRKSHYKDAYSDSDSDEAYPRSSYHGKKVAPRYKYYANSASSDAVSYSLSRTSCRELKRCCSRIVAICRMARDTAGTQTEQYWGDTTSRLRELNKMDDGVPQAIVDGLATANPKVVEQIMQMLRKRRKCKVCACGVMGDNGAPVVKDDMIVLKFEENEPMLPPVMCIDERSRSSCSCGNKLAETESEIIRDIIRKKRLLEKSQRINALTNTGKSTSCDRLSTCTCVNGQDEMEFVQGLLRRSRNGRDRPGDSTSAENMNSIDCECTTRKAKELAAEIMKELVQGHMQKMFVDKIENQTRHDSERVSSKSADTIIGLSSERFAAKNSCACEKSGRETMLTKERAYDARESIKSRADNCTCNADESALKTRKSKRTTYWADADDGSSMMFQKSERSKPFAGECTCHGDDVNSMIQTNDSIVPRDGECTCHGAGSPWKIRKSERIAPQAGECTCDVHESASITRNSERIVPRAGECTCNVHESASMVRKSERIVRRAGECTCAADETPIVSRRSHRSTHRRGECTCYPDEGTTELAMSERIKAAVTECTSNSDDSITVIRISGRPCCTCNTDGNPPKTHQGMATQREAAVASNIPRYSKFPMYSASAEPTRRNTERGRETMTTEYQTLLEESLSQVRQANAIPRSTVSASERESELPMRAWKNAYTSITEEPQSHRNGTSRDLMRETKAWEHKGSVFPKGLESDPAAGASNRQSEYQGVHRKSTNVSTMDIRLGESDIKDSQRKSNIDSESSPRESQRTSGVIAGASDRRSEYQAQPRIAASNTMIIKPQRHSQRSSSEFADMGEDKTEFETSRNYSARDSSFTDNERKRSTLETNESIELSTVDTYQRKPTKHQLIKQSEADSRNVEEKRIINETPKITDYTQAPRRTDCGCRATNTETDARPENYEERYLGEYEEKSLRPIGVANYGANKCRTDCGCKIVGTALHTRSKTGELEDVREYEERIMTRASSSRASRPANYAATMYNPESDYTKAFREGKASPFEEAIAAVHDNGQQNDRPHPAIEDDGLSRTTTDHGSLQKFVIDIKACKQATASCTLTTYPKSNINGEHEISRSIMRVDAENNESDLLMKQRAALCAELTVNELLPQHSLRTLLTKLSSPRGKLYAQNEFPQKGHFNPTIFRAQTLQTMDNTFKLGAEDMRQIQVDNRSRDIKLALSAPSIITRYQHSAINGPEGTQSKVYKKSLIPLPVGSRRPATTSMPLMQSTSAERRTNSRPLINQTSDSNHQITRLNPKQTKTGTETKQQEQPNTKPTYSRGTKRAYLAPEKNARSASDMQLSYGTGYTAAHPRLSSGRHKEIQTNSSIFSRTDMRQQSSENNKRIWKNSQAEPRTPKMVNILSAAKQQHNSSSTLSSASSECRKSDVSQTEYKPRNGHCKAFYKRTGRHHNLRNPFSGYTACNEPPLLLKTATIVATTKKRRESNRSRTVSDDEETNSDVECITVEYASSDAAFQDSYAQYQAELQRQQQQLWRIDNVREAIKVEEQEAERAKNQLRTTLTGELLERAMHYPTRVWNEERKQLNLQRNGATIFGPL
uniref:Uncharacterized protein n=1 Tax=Ceratitis capitata TaxID=7213 RepID=W8AKF9_CERCA